MRFECPAEKPVTMKTGGASLADCYTCSERNGNTANPVYDDLVGDCVSCYEYDSSTPVWDGNACVACANDESYDTASGTCVGAVSCDANNLCKLTRAINTCETGYIAIDTAEKLAKIGVDSNYPLSGNYCLLNDISLAAYDESVIVDSYSTQRGWTPIGAFSGILDGNGNEITNLYMYYQGASCDNARNVALISSSSGTIRNLGIVVESFSFESAPETGNFSALVGVNDGTISNCHVTGNDISGTLAGCSVGRGSFGTLTAINNGVITDSSVVLNALVDPTDSVGSSGIFVGVNYGTITKSYVKGIGGATYGALVGYFAGGTISQSYAISDISFIDGVSFEGGYSSTENPTTIENCYSIMNKDSSEARGLVRWFDLGEPLTITNSYVVTYSPLESNYDGAIVGGQGYASLVTVENSFYDYTLSGAERACCGGGNICKNITCNASGKTTTEMQTPQTFINAGWDTTIWELVQGQYPKLKGVGGQE